MTLATGAVVGDVLEVCATLTGDGTPGGTFSLNGGGITSGTLSGTHGPLTATWAAERLYLGASGGGNHSNIEFIELKVLPGVHSMGTCRAI
jgi:hypothetical protein